MLLFEHLLLFFSPLRSTGLRWTSVTGRSGKTTLTTTCPGLTSSQRWDWPTCQLRRCEIFWRRWFHPVVSPQMMNSMGGDDLPELDGIADEVTALSLLTKQWLLLWKPLGRCYHIVNICKRWPPFWWRFFFFFTEMQKNILRQLVNESLSSETQRNVINSLSLSTGFCRQWWWM